MERYIFWDREISTKLTLLRTLYLEEYWLSTEKLVKLSTLDKRTVLKYMKLLQADSDSLPDTYDSIILSRKGLGHRFIGGKPAYVDFVHQLVSSSIPFSFISELYLHSYVDLEDFSEEYFISMTSLKELIGKFRTFFEPLEIFLVQEKGIISVTGNEISFRFFGYTFFWRITKGVY
ncbi:helix-turn-helix domain-containing protein [Enterococcus sp. BWR-S5]|uniref:helix-turn-helix domain-containing protein n=1 Tax=Enterococcus sp. BWR-S5 TaxID=2787714 RepID=UPI001922608C|nr:helix-turn-helix domain-containing protein [Enterococcus sp. BWR-S5]MBL1226678.1 helix-turn-helix domain-containing protein [Enterococcus sp. BWR-S5]